MAGCGRCKRRGNLLSRTFSRAISRNTQSSTSNVTVGQSCSGKVRLTKEGYVMTCDVCGVSGDPVSFPESATVENGECGKGT